MLLFPCILLVNHPVCLPQLMSKDPPLPCPRFIWKGLVFQFHGSAGYCVCLIFTHIGYVYSFSGIGVTFPSCEVYIISLWVAVGNVIVYFNCNGVTPSRGTLTFFAAMVGLEPLVLVPHIILCVSLVMIICLSPLVLTVIALCCASWASAAFGPLSFCSTIGLLFVLGIWCGYIYCGGGGLLLY